MDIRKVSIGADYKSSSMHYIVGQDVLGGNYTIHLIRQDQSSNSIKIWIQQRDEILLWKEFNSQMPIAIEYNINF
jgi:hypothetical protein|tara:strand:+ start:612 stop:836 length:225 start_codon:yes stop_codon:yes gene_type:complete